MIGVIFSFGCLLVVVFFQVGLTDIEMKYDVVVAESRSQHKLNVM